MCRKLFSFIYLEDREFVECCLFCYNVYFLNVCDNGLIIIILFFLFVMELVCFNILKEVIFEGILFNWLFSFFLILINKKII